jgi:hypothetical protein
MTLGFAVFFFFFFFKPKYPMMFAMIGKLDAQDKTLHALEITANIMRYLA